MYSLSKLLKKLNIPFQQMGRRTDDSFEKFAPAEKADIHSLIFINKPNSQTSELLKSGSFSVVLLNHDWGTAHADELNLMDISIFLVENPRLVLAHILKILYPWEDDFDKGVHPTANIHPKAVIHPSVSIGQYCQIGECIIGENSRIQTYTIIKDNVIIGKNVIIREHCLIGGCGFGFVRDDTGHLTRIPHIGKVIIEDDVEIFPYTNVDRATFDATIIKAGAKIDHFVHIGHNSIVGEDSIITAGIVLCGGSNIGKRSWVGVHSVIKEKINVGDDVTIGLGSVVVKDIKNGMVVVGVPAKPLIKES